MIKRVCCLLFILYLPLLMAADESTHFKIKGVKGKLLVNIQNRLEELAQNQSLNNFSDEDLAAQISKAMYPYGYFQPDIKIRKIGNRLTVTITPGPRLLIDQLLITVVGEGKNNPIINQALHNFPIKQGDNFNSVRYEAAKQTLLNAAEHQGYLHASYDKAEILINKVTYTSNIHLMFNTGPQYYFGQVQFDPTYISPEVLRRYIPFNYGQPYSNDQILAFNNSLLGSGYFKDVSIQPQTSDGAIIPLDVHLQRASRINYSLGLGFGTDTKIRGRAGYHVVPVNRSGHKFNATLLGSFRENALQTQYIIPGKKPTIDQLELMSAVSNLHYDSGNSNSLLLSMGQRHNLANFQRVLSLNGLYERFDYTNHPKYEELTLFPKASLTWLKRSEALFSPNGYKVTLNGLAAKKSLLSEISFTQASLDAKAALTLPLLRTRLYFHTFQGITQTDDVYRFPLSLALLLGGAENLKGYSYNSIGPGKILSYGGFELQKETKENWYIIGFIDAGSVYKPLPKTVQRDLGIGIMWVSPVGPIKIGLAQPVDNHFNRRSHTMPKLVINMGPDL